MTSEYRENFIKADNTFLYQLVYDPLQRKLVPLTPYPDDLNHAQMPYAGKFLDDTTAFQLAVSTFAILHFLEILIQFSAFNLNKA